MRSKYADNWLFERGGLGRGGGGGCLQGYREGLLGRTNQREVRMIEKGPQLVA